MQPAVPTRPLDSNPLSTPRTSLTPRCPTNGDPVSLSVRASPDTIRNGTQVELTVTVGCPMTRPQVVAFSGSVPTPVSDAVNQTYHFFINQIPSTTLAAGATSVVTRFTARGLSTTVPIQLQAEITGQHPLASSWVAIRIEGDGSVVSTPTAPVCNPTATFNIIETAVISGANVNAEVNLSCALAVESIWQIVSSNHEILPGPPGGTLRLAAGSLKLQFQLTASRTTGGTVTLRAVRSFPAGGVTNSDSVTVTH